MSMLSSLLLFQAIGRLGEGGIGVAPSLQHFSGWRLTPSETSTLRTKCTYVEQPFAIIANSFVRLIGIADAVGES
jgi:hypothetical protein